MKNKAESAGIKAARAQLRKHIKTVGAERDSLRELISDLEELATSCDEAQESLIYAVNVLSRYA